MFCATATALLREGSYVTLPPLSLGRWTVHFAPLGPVAIVLANLIVVLVMSFYKFDTLNQMQWQGVGYRTGALTVAQMPLIFLLAGRQNIIGYLTGMGYERLIWFHRWVARTLWLSATIHMGFWFRIWGQSNLITVQLHNNPLAQRGFAAWCILTFIVISSVAPVRRISYEFFVLQHLVTFVGFTVAAWLHVPEDVKAWVWVPIGLLIFDRVARYAWATYANLSIFHRSSSKHPLWANRASFTPLPGNVTRITIENPGVRWSPGQHVFLTCHSIVPLQCHPFTISSLPSDGKMEFLVRAHKGGTRRFFRYASKHDNVLGSGALSLVKKERTVFIDGPYGLFRPLQQFDSVALLTGGMGVTFTIPFLRDIVADWKQEAQQQGSGKRHTATKRVRFVWVIKSRAQLRWFEAQLQAVLEDMVECHRLQPEIPREIEITIYITCDEPLEAPDGATLDKIQGTIPPAPAAIRTTHKDDTVTVQPASSLSSSGQQFPATPQGGCLPDDGDCCSRTNRIEDEDEITPEKDQQQCMCPGHAPPSSPSFTSTQATNEKATSDEAFTKANPITLVSGRPQPRTIIRKMLEKAQGESAVVVCGPEGLSDDVRRSVVALSNERAVHKGSGAQGIFLHVEGFGW